MTLTYELAGLIGLYTALAAVIDYRQHRIPNYLTVPAALLGLAYHSFMPSGMGWLMSLAGFAVGFSLLLLPWLLGGGGMGDVKLLAALGAWLGPLLVLVAFAVSTLLASSMALAILIWHTFNKGVSSTKRRYLAAAGTTQHPRARKKKRVLPFAVPVALSTWAVLLWLAAMHTT